MIAPLSASSPYSTVTLPRFSGEFKICVPVITQKSSSRIPQQIIKKPDVACFRSIYTLLKEASQPKKGWISRLFDRILSRSSKDSKTEQNTSREILDAEWSQIRKDGWSHIQNGWFTYKCENKYDKSVLKALNSLCVEVDNNPQKYSIPYVPPRENLNILYPPRLEIKSTDRGVPLSKNRKIELIDLVNRITKGNHAVLDMSFPFIQKTSYLDGDIYFYFPKKYKSLLKKQIDKFIKQNTELVGEFSTYKNNKSEEKLQKYIEKQAKS